MCQEVKIGKAEAEGPDGRLLFCRHLKGHFCSLFIGSGEGAVSLCDYFSVCQMLIQSIFTSYAVVLFWNLVFISSSFETAFLN